MTPDDALRALAAKACPCNDCETFHEHDCLARARPAVEAALREWGEAAVRAERERCAKYAEAQGGLGCLIADAIRARTHEEGGNET